MVKNYLFLLLSLLITTSTKCTGGSNDKTMSIIQAVEKATNDWMKMDGVEGVAQSKSGEEDSIMVLVSKPVSEMEKLLPKNYQGYPVELMFTGQIDIEQEGVQEE